MQLSKILFSLSVAMCALSTSGYSIPNKGMIPSGGGTGSSSSMTMPTRPGTGMDSSGTMPTRPGTGMDSTGTTRSTWESSGTRTKPSGTNLPADADRSGNLPSTTTDPEPDAK